MCTQCAGYSLFGSQIYPTPSILCSVSWRLISVASPPRTICPLDSGCSGNGRNWQEIGTWRELMVYALTLLWCWRTSIFWDQRFCRAAPLTFPHPGSFRPTCGNNFRCCYSLDCPTSLPGSFNNSHTFIDRPFINLILVKYFASAICSLPRHS